MTYVAAAESVLIFGLGIRGPTTAAWASEKSASSSSAAATPTVGCPSDKAVWVNKRSKAYPVEGDRLFGPTKNGRFECKKAADGEGDYLAEGK